LEKYKIANSEIYLISSLLDPNYKRFSQASDEKAIKKWDSKVKRS
jgi:hypothetical protein